MQYVASLPKKFEDRLVIISCDEDITHCQAAVHCGIPVVTSEFLLTGILQQRLDVDAYPLPLVKYWHLAVVFKFMLLLFL